MNQLTFKQQLALLVRVYNCSIQDFFYFPDVIIFGKQRMEKEEFLFLLSEGYIAAYKVDSFGKFYRLTKKADEFIHHTIYTKPVITRPRIKIPVVQGCFSFLH